MTGHLPRLTDEHLELRLAAARARYEADTSDVAAYAETAALYELQIRRAADLSEENLSALRRWASSVLKKGAMSRLDADALTGVLLVIAAHQETPKQ